MFNLDMFLILIRRSPVLKLILILCKLTVSLLFSFFLAFCPSRTSGTDHHSISRIHCGGDHSFLVLSHGKVSHQTVQNTIQHHARRCKYRRRGRTKYVVRIPNERFTGNVDILNLGSFLGGKKSLNYYCTSF